MSTKPEAPKNLKKHRMFNNRITWARMLILGAFFLLFTFGGFWIGSNTHIVLPIFNCEYVGGGTTRGICIAIIDFNKRLNFAFMASMVGCLIGMILLGRLWCGYVCPMGFIQDIMTLIRQKLKIPQMYVPQELKPFITVAKWYCLFYILFYDLCKVCPIQYFTVPAGGYVSRGGNGGWAYIWAVVLVIICTLSDRAACRVCPIGALTGLFNKVSGARIKKCGAACTHCRACLEACPMDIQAIYEDRENEDVTCQECLYCMKCIEVCPEKAALRFEFFGFKILESRRETKIKLGQSAEIPSQEKIE